MTQDVEGRDGLGCQPDKHAKFHRHAAESRRARDRKAIHSLQSRGPTFSYSACTHGVPVRRSVSSKAPAARPRSKTGRASNYRRANRAGFVSRVLSSWLSSWVDSSLYFGLPAMCVTGSPLFPHAARGTWQARSRVACVGGASCCSEYQRRGWLHPPKSAAINCPPRQKVAPQFTPGWRALSGPTKQPSVGPRPQAKARASASSGCAAKCPPKPSSRSSDCLIDHQRHSSAVPVSSFGYSHFDLPQTFARSDKSAQASGATLTDRSSDHGPTKVQARVRCAVAHGLHRDLVSARARLGRRATHPVRLDHRRWPLADRRHHRQPAVIRIPAPRGLTGAEQHV